MLAETKKQAKNSLNQAKAEAADIYTKQCSGKIKKEQLVMLLNYINGLTVCNMFILGRVKKVGFRLHKVDAFVHYVTSTL